MEIHCSDTSAPRPHIDAKHSVSFELFAMYFAAKIGILARDIRPHFFVYSVCKNTGKSAYLERLKFLCHSLFMDSLLAHIFHTHGFRYEPIDEFNFKVMVYLKERPKENIVAIFPLSDLEYGADYFEKIVRDLVLKLNPPIETIWRNKL